MSSRGRGSAAGGATATWALGGGGNLGRCCRHGLRAETLGLLLKPLFLVASSVLLRPTYAVSGLEG